MKHVNLRILFASVCTIALVGGLGTFKASADSWDKKTILTINEPIQVRDRLLEPGTYVFKLLNSNSDRHVVQIFNEDQSHIVDTVMAIPNYRLQPTGHSRFGFWETPPGHAKALRAWFYPGDNFGQEFPYPKHLAVTETASNVTITRTPEVAQTTPAPEPAQPTAAPEPAPVETHPAEPQVVARNEAPPEPAPMAAEPAPAPAPEPAPAPQAQTTPQPDTLPKTATNTTLIGLIGLSCLGLFGLVRDKGTARRS